MNDELEAALQERTEAARAAAVAKHVGSMPERVKRWLVEILQDFVTSNPVGILGAHAYAATGPGLPPLDETYDKDKGFLIFVWPASLCAMLQKVAETEEGRVAPDVSSALNALEDRMSIFAYEEWQADASNPKALLSRLDQAASAYSVGLAMGWAGITKNAPKDVQRVRRIVGTLEPEERFLLAERYGRRRSTDELQAKLGVKAHQLGYELARILEIVRARAPN